MVKNLINFGKRLMTYGIRRTVQGYPQITQITPIKLSRKHEIKKTRDSKKIFEFKHF